MPQLINAKSGETVEKLAAGMGNSILIPRTWLGDTHREKLSPMFWHTSPKNVYK